MHKTALTFAVCFMAGCAKAAAQTSPPPPPPPPPALEFVFEARVLLGRPVKVGETAIGGRNIISILGGRLEGPSLRGEILPGGWDWQLERKDGCIGIKADYMLKTDDGVVINIVDTGVNCTLVPEHAQPPRTTPVFEVPRGKYDWLARSAFIGAAQPFSGPDGSGLTIRVFKVK
ncbi:MULTISPECIES: DUF3237 domain-containing protein [unclassified Sphingomonas]|uniref:DUF3237 domain-containing protein n=1 Tax=Novosphingobium rhizosphaerae TaxID=1551649 RepID=UPI0015CC44E7